MTLPVWLLIALPLLGAVVLLLGGRATNAWGHLLGCATVLASFVVGVVLFVDLLSRGAEDRVMHETLFSWVPVAQPAGRLRPPTRPAVGVFRPADHRRRLADPPLLGRLHGARPRAPTVLRLPEPVRRGDAAAGARRQLPRPLRRLGGRRPGVVPADRLLVAQAVGRRPRRRRRSSSTASATSAWRSR